MALTKPVDIKKQSILKRIVKWVQNFFKKDCCKVLIPVVALSLFNHKVFAQADTIAKPKVMMDNMAMMPMTSSFSLNLPMSRDGSGTSWQPDANPMAMYMIMKKNTMIMFHGAFFLRYTSQDVTNESNRGGSQFDAPDWMMFMLIHKLSDKDLISFNSMFSLDYFTENGNAGYPLLFQTGETANGIPLVDRQHPHNLFSELAVNYTHSFTKDFDANIYIGYPGEPALGPEVFMHRLSAMDDPDAPIGHHWQDATHITFGVATIGFRYKIAKLEVSYFNGSEPSEQNRLGFDKPQFNSYSYRLSVNPNDNFSLQFSQGYLKSPEALEPNINVVRTTASIMHTKPFWHKNFIASSLVWGMNQNSNNKTLQSFLAESDLHTKPITVYMRYEFVQKDADELQLLERFDNTDPTFNINAFTLGVNKVLLTEFRTDLSLGVQGTIDIPDNSLIPIYGNHPLSAEIYLKLSPALGHSSSLK